MIAQRKHWLLVLIAVSPVCASSASALAQCATCGAQAVGYQPVTYQAAYAPVAYQAAYAPVTYQAAYAPAPVAYSSYYSGWYPGYWFDRANRSVWGAPVTTTAYYQPTYTAAYAPAYTAAYAPVTYAASYQPTYTVGVCAGQHLLVLRRADMPIVFDLLKLRRELRANLQHLLDMHCKFCSDLRHLLDLCDADGRSRVAACM